MTVKKTISLLLSVLMLISIFTVCPLTANAEDDEIINQFNCVEYLEKAGVNIANLHNTLVNGFSQCKTNINLSSFNINHYTYEYATKAIHRYLYYYIPDYYCFISDKVCYSNGSTVSYLDVTYDERFNTPQKLSEAHSQIESAENKILQDIKGNDNLTEVEKALLVHDRLVALIDYDKGYYDDNIDPDSYYLYSALVQRKAVCNGYSIAYSYLMNKIGIKTYLVRSDNLNHAWNITYINNKPYYVDVTWDDATFALDGYVEHDNFLRSLNGIIDTLHISDDDSIDYLTSLNGTEINDTTYDNYYWQNSKAEFQLIDNQIYYIDNENATLNRADENHTVLYNIPDKWTSYSKTIEGAFKKSKLSNGYLAADVEHPYWWDNCSRLSSLNKTLLFSGSDSIYKYDTETDKLTTAFIPNKTLYNKIEDYYSIFGFKYEADYLYCYLYHNVICDENKEDYLIKQRYTGEDIPRSSYTVVLNYDETRGTAAGDGAFTEGGYTTLEAKNLPGYIFDGYYENGILLNSDSSFKLAVNSDMIIEVRFSECGHENLTSTVIPAGCIENGYTENSCPDCGYTYHTDETESFGSHNYKDGFCTRCGEKDTDYLETEHPYQATKGDTKTIYKPKADHIAITFSDKTKLGYYDSIFVYDGNDTEIGEYKTTELADKRLVIAGDTVKIKLVAKYGGSYYGYSLTNVEVSYETCQHPENMTERKGAIASTCSEKGYSGDLYCNECGRLVKEGEELPLDENNHNLGEWIMYPNCSCEGYTYHYCIDCDYEYKDNYTPVNGEHLFRKGICDYCGAIDKSYDFPILTESPYTNTVTIDEYSSFTLSYTPKQNETVNFSEIDDKDIYAYCREYDEGTNESYYIRSYIEYDNSLTYNLEKGKNYYFEFFNYSELKKDITINARITKSAEQIATDPVTTEPTAEQTQPATEKPTQRTSEEPTEYKPTPDTQPVTDNPGETKPYIQPATDKQQNEPYTQPADKSDETAPDTRININYQVNPAVKPTVINNSNYTMISVKDKTIKAKKLRKKAQKIKPVNVVTSLGKVSYSIIKKGTSKKIRKLVKINSKGVITIKKWKKAKKGNYKIKIKISAPGFKKAVTKTIRLKIK